MRPIILKGEKVSLGVILRENKEIWLYTFTELKEMLEIAGFNVEKVYGEGTRMEESSR